MNELIYKPDSVLNGHLSRQYVAILLKQPTRILDEQPNGIPIWFCFKVGFTLPRLLPISRWALTPPFHPYQFLGGILSVALAVGSRLPGVTWHLTL